MLLLAVLGMARFGVAQQHEQTLSHHLRPAVLSGKAEVVGALPPERQLNFSIILPLRNPKELASLLKRLYDPTSVDFRHFLSVDQFTAAFGPTADDYQAVVSFARSNGFTVTASPANRLVVPVRGSVDQINKAFHLRMTEYRHPIEDRNFYSPDREPSLDLAVPVAHISGLDNYSNPKPMVKRSDRDLKLGVQAANITGSGPEQSYLGSDMRAAYYGGTTLDGDGQSVGLVEFGGYYLSDVDATFSTAGQSYTVPVNNVLLDGASAEPEENEDDSEQVLDIVQAIGMAPGLDQVRVYIGAGNDDANVLNSMASENIAKSLSSSWSWLPVDPTTDDVFFEEFAAQGQSFFVASGDAGAYDAEIDPYFYPAEDAYVTAVGGTHLTTNGPGGSWASEIAWNSCVAVGHRHVPEWWLHDTAQRAGRRHGSRCR
jgi:subtilase family serine protease